MSLGEEDLGVLMKILVENIGEGSKEHSMDVSRQVAQGNFTQCMMGNLTVETHFCSTLTIFI